MTANKEEMKISKQSRSISALRKSKQKPEKIKKL